jgi:hypothetical protein
MFAPPPVSLALAGLDASAGFDPLDVRAALAWACSIGARGVTLNAVQPGLRPRELDRSARKDLGALLRRSDLAFTGLDLWIPPEHLLSAEHVDRAVGAVRAAFELSADLAAAAGSSDRGVVSLALPRPLPLEIRSALIAAADLSGVCLADHAWPWADGSPSPLLATGLDPATVLAAGADPVAQVTPLGGRLALARLSDLTAAGRSAVGSAGARLDLAAYAAALMASGYPRAAVLDLRGAGAQALVAQRAVDAWARSLPGIA